MRLIITKTWLVLFTLFANAAAAQSVDEHPANSKGVDQLINFYHAFTGESDPIYNGCEYSRFSYYINSGIPFFMVDTMTAGSVMYDGILYKDIPMMYDMIIDELITKDFSGNNLIKLVKQKVDSFYLNGGKFISIHNSNKVMQQGYYQLLRQGKIDLLKKEIKYIEDKVRPGEALEKNILSKDAYYIKYNGEYFAIANARSLISIVPGNREGINKLIEDYNSRNKKTDLGVLLPGLIDYYNQSTE